MGRGKKRHVQPTIQLSDGGRDRRLPASLQSALTLPASNEDLYDFELLRPLRRRFQDGYTETEVEAVGQQLAMAIGWPLVVIWDYVDSLACGGAAEEYLFQNNRFYPLPECLYGLLWEGELPEVETLTASLTNQQPQGGFDIFDLTKVDDYNYAAEDQR